MQLYKLDRPFDQQPTSCNLLSPIRQQNKKITKYKKQIEMVGHGIKKLLCMCSIGH